MLSSVYYRIASKSQPVFPIIQFNHIRRFQGNFSPENIWVSPFIYDEKNGVNISRITTTEKNHALLTQMSDVTALNVPVNIKKFTDWKNGETILQNNLLEISFITPMAVRYQDKRIYYKNPVSLFDILWGLRTSVPQEYFDTDLSILNGKPTKLLMNLGFSEGTLSFVPLYDRGQTKISGVVGHVGINVEELFESREIHEIISYFMYLLNYFPIGLRRLCLAYSYRPDIIPVPELSTPQHQYGISINPISLHAVLYELRTSSE